MAISFVGTTGFVSGTGALSVAISTTSAQSGDLLLAFVNTANQIGSTVPQIDSTTNFTALTSGYAGTGTAGSAGAVDLGVFYYWYTGSGTNITFGDVGSYQTMTVVALRGVNTVTPFSGTANRVDASATTTVTLPLNTAPSSTQWLVHAIGLDRDTTTNPYAVFATYQTGAGSWSTGFQTNLLGGTDLTGATTNAGAGGGIYGAMWNSSYAPMTSATFNDSTTHAYVSFYVNPVEIVFKNTGVGGDEHPVSSTTVALPTQALPGDLVLFATAIQGSGLALTTPDGWTLLKNQTSDTNVYLSIFWRVRQAGDSSSVTVNITGGTSQTGSYSWAYGAVRTTSPLGVPVGVTDNTSDTSLATPALTTLASGSYRFAVGAASDAITSGSWAPPSGMTGIGSHHGTSGYRPISGAHALNASPTTHAASSFTTGTVSTKGATIAFEIFPTVWSGTLTTSTGGATGAGGTGALTASGGSGTLSTTTGNATAAGGTGSIYPTSNSLATTTGDATAAGGSGALTGTVSATLSTTTGSATGAGGTGALTGTTQQDATLTTTTGSAAAAGGTGALTGTANATLTTTTGDATAAGGTGALTVSATLTTTAGDASAGGGSGALTGTVSATLTTTTGDASAAGGTGALTGTVQSVVYVDGVTISVFYTAGAGDATLGTTTGNATAAGESGALTGGATLTTTVGDAAAAGESGALTGTVSATFTTTTGAAAASGEQGAFTADATFTTTTGDAAAAGGTGALTGTTVGDGLLTTATGDAQATGGTGALTADATVTTTAGEAAAAGGTGALTGGATLTTAEGSAISQGGTGALTSDAALSTSEGTAAAGGDSSALTGGAALSTETGNAAATGGTGALTGTVQSVVYIDGITVTVSYTPGVSGDISLATNTGQAVASGGSATLSGTAVLASISGDASATGGTGSLTGGASLSTITGDASASGGSGVLTGTATLSTTTGSATASGGNGALTAATIFSTTTGTAGSGGGTGSITGVQNVVLLTVMAQAAALGEIGRLLATSPNDGLPVEDPQVEVVTQPTDVLVHATDRRVRAEVAPLGVSVVSSGVADSTPDLRVQVESYAGRVRVM